MVKGVKADSGDGLAPAASPCEERVERVVENDEGSERRSSQARPTSCDGCNTHQYGSRAEPVAPAQVERG